MREPPYLPGSERDIPAERVYQLGELTKTVLEDATRIYEQNKTDSLNNLLSGIEGLDFFGNLEAE